jgi:hypothetical protein
MMEQPAAIFHETTRIVMHGTAWKLAATTPVVET